MQWSIETVHQYCQVEVEIMRVLFRFFDILYLILFPQVHSECRNQRWTILMRMPAAHVHILLILAACMNVCMRVVFHRIHVCMCSLYSIYACFQLYIAKGIYDVVLNKKIKFVLSTWHPWKLLQSNLSLEIVQGTEKSDLLSKRAWGDWCRQEHTFLSSIRSVLLK